jgi:hypothetical protein
MIKPKLEVYIIKKVVRADSDLSLSKATTYMDFSCAVCILCSFYAGLLRFSPTINMLAKYLKIGIILS